MFGDMMGMMNKIKEAQKKVEETKNQLNNVLLHEKSTDGLLDITITGNREIKEIKLDNSLLNDKEQLEDYLLIHINRAIQKAHAMNEKELGAAAQDGMPDLSGFMGK